MKNKNKVKGLNEAFDKSGQASKNAANIDSKTTPPVKNTTFREGVGKARKVLNKFPAGKGAVGKTITGRALKAVGRGIMRTGAGLVNTVHGAILTGASAGLSAGDLLTGGATSDELKAISKFGENPYLRAAGRVGEALTNPVQTVMNPLDTISKLFTDSPYSAPKFNPTRPGSNIASAAQTHTGDIPTNQKDVTNKSSIPDFKPLPQDANGKFSLNHGVSSDIAPIVDKSQPNADGLFNGAKRIDATTILDNGQIQKFGLAGPNGTILPVPKGKGTFNVMKFAKPPTQPTTKERINSVLNAINKDDENLSLAGNQGAYNRGIATRALHMQELKALSGIPSDTTLSDAKTIASIQNLNASTLNAQNKVKAATDAAQKLGARQKLANLRRSFSSAINTDAKNGVNTAKIGLLQSLGISVDENTSIDKLMEAMKNLNDGVDPSQINDVLSGITEQSGVQ